MAEVGVHKGKFSAELLELQPDRLYLVDPWKRSMANLADVCGVGRMRPECISEEEEKEAQENVRFGVQEGRVVIFREFSPLAASFVQNESLDVVYVDGDHSYEAVAADLRGWTRKLRANGLLCGDDWGAPDVRKAVHQWMGRNPMATWFAWSGVGDWCLRVPHTAQ
eukprot:TRINITY_DN87826_c0_g1_i1.p1 TRINITY_DN87826_c0_g1~~TRINITY_DN87826_c0_g1_i1.p1  ORF type:complete len:166 (-),score=19.92 TRINITY_DN87826_c0_g1_i1:88-585(-)